MSSLKPSVAARNRNQQHGDGDGQGKNAAEAEEITKTAVVEALAGLPPQKMHCSNLASDGLKKAIEDYRSRHKDK